MLKLGGSVVTIKDMPMKADTANIERLSGEISTAGLKQLVIVNGGGSFGHPVAKRYGIMGGDASINNPFGVSETHRSMVALNSLIVEALLALKVPALSIAPSSFLITDEGRIKTANFTIIHRLIELGKQFDYMAYPNRNHGLREGSGTAIHLRMLMTRYLIEHLPSSPK